MNKSSTTTLVVFLAVLGAYLATRTQVHTFDALSYVLDVDRKPWQEVFHPHHLAYGLLGATLRGMLSAMGWQGSVMVPLQVVNALAGALGIALFFDLVRGVTRRLDLALCAALLLGGSYAYWYYAVEIEVYTIATVFLVLCLRLMIRLLKQPALHLWVVLGSVQAMAVLFHQTNVLLCVPIGVLLLYTAMKADGNPWPCFLRHSLAYALPLVGVAGGAYLLVGVGISGLYSWSELSGWMLTYAHTGWWGGAVTGETWSDLGTGLAHTLAYPGGALLGLLLVGVLVFSLPRLWRAYPTLLALLMCWLLVYGGFFVWWEPDNVEFWIASMPPAVLLLVLGLTGAPRYHPGVWVVAAIGITMAGVNYDSISYRGNPANDVHRQNARVLAEQSNPVDVLLVSDELLALYLPYYESRPYAWSLNQAMFEAQGDWKRACTLVHAQIASALWHGAAVIVAEDVIAPPVEPAPLNDPVLQRFGLSQAQVTACFANYLPFLHSLDVGADVPAYLRLPSAQEMAVTTGWDFSYGRWGWQAERISDERFVQGWDFVPGVDPQLWSPRLALDTSRYTAIEMRLAATAATTATAKFELFFVSEQRVVDESVAVERTLERGSEQKYATKTYGITLEGREGWSGIVTGLRLDPIGEGDGGRVRVEWIRLVERPDTVLNHR